MSAEDRRQKFQERVQTERQLLLLVNGLLPVATPLAGTTVAAVEKWRGILKQEVGAENAEKISNAVLSVSQRISVNSDLSQDVFEEDEPSAISIQSLMDDLSKMIIALMVKG